MIPDIADTAPVTTSAQLVEYLRGVLADLDRAELEARYYALPGRVGSGTLLSDAALIDVIVFEEQRA